MLQNIKQPDSKDHVLHDSISMQYPEQATPQVQCVKHPGLGVGVRFTAIGHRKTPWWNVLKLGRMMVAHLYTFAEIIDLHICNEYIL